MILLFTLAALSFFAGAAIGISKQQMSTLPPLFIGILAGLTFLALVLLPAMLQLDPFEWITILPAMWLFAAVWYWPRKDAASTRTGDRNHVR